ncbi:hypothetical protein P3X46_026129 [Hevea brasiliensis]|uniref:PGG domain-containing protein n=2 Tax=Hevea brasiliensis TaxID=3981 RepID=A0ABQ9KZ12_HEVBR|nr:hypothetical protein P3X46_026129 [Hevea brasiliensis]
MLFKDAYGGTPLHWAAFKGDLDAVGFLLSISRSTIFEKDHRGYFPIHIASKADNVKVIKMLVERWHEPEELLTTEGRNILHVAAMNRSDNVVRYILATPELRKLLNERDINGDTPLHLAAGYCHPGVVLSLTRQKGINLNYLNNEMLTPFDVYCKYKDIAFFEEMKLQNGITFCALSSAGCEQSLDLNTHKEKRIVTMLPNPAKIQWMKDQVGALLTAGTLVATGTFTAGFALPGGYNSPDNNPDKGTATMINNHMFQLFMICNTASFYCSIICILCCSYALLGDVYPAVKALRLAGKLFGVALPMMSLAFMAALHVVTGKLSWLASLILIMGTISLVILFTDSIISLAPLDWNLPLVRSVSYCICRLLVFVFLREYDAEPPAYLSEKSGSKNKKKKSKKKKSKDKVEKESSSKNMNEKSKDMDEKDE